MKNSTNNSWDTQKQYSTPTLELLKASTCVLNTSAGGLDTPSDGFLDDLYEF